MEKEDGVSDYWKIEYEKKKEWLKLNSEKNWEKVKEGWVRRGNAEKEVVWMGNGVWVKCVDRQSTWGI